MKKPISYLLGLAAIAVLVIGGIAFLQRPSYPPGIPRKKVPPHPALEASVGLSEIKYTSYAGHVAELSKAVGKSVLLPHEALEFATKLEAQKTGRIFASSDSFASPPPVRRMLDVASFALRMYWDYDPTRDQILLDFQWHRTDPRTAVELVEVLRHSTPLPDESGTIIWTCGNTSYFRRIPFLPQRDYFGYYIETHELDPDETWRLAFDALLSKPVNFSRTWKLRFAEDLRQFFPSRVDNLYCGKVLDLSGTPHLLIINEQQPAINLGLYTFSYYVFDLKGQFEQGGIANSGHRGEFLSVRVNFSRTRITLRSYFNGTSAFDQHFNLNAAGLVLKEVIDDSGAVVPPSEYGGYGFNQSLLHVP